MKKIVHSFTLLLIAYCLLGGLQPAYASHLLGGDLTYTSLGGNSYRVKFRLYRDCTGIPPGTFNLECRTGGCNSSATVTATLLQQGGVLPGNPFCAAVSAGPCQGPAGLPNYDVYSYQADVTLPPGNWTLSTFGNARPTLANITTGTGGTSGNLYVQATLDNRVAPNGSAVINNSPQFDPLDIPIQYVCWKQPTTITYSALEADGDSLVYSLTTPLQDCDTPAPYTPYPGLNGGVFIITRSPLCVLEIPGLAGTTFSANLPLPVTIDTTGSCPIKQGAPRFEFNQRARTISFTPNVFYPNTQSALGRNKYQLAVLITEYRRINGVRRVIGTVRREANLIVTDCGSNTTPNPVQSVNQTVNSNTTTINTRDTTQIDVYSCSYSRVQLNFTDPDNLRIPSAGQLLTVTLPPNINTDPNLLASGDVGTFAFSTNPAFVNGSTNPRGTFIFQPSPSMVGRVIRINIRVEDNNCPIKGSQNRVVVIRILRGNFATAAATVGSPGIGGQTPASVCPGGSIILQGNVLRPDSIRRLANNTTVVQTYGFQWTALNNTGSGSGMPAVTNTRNLSVNPTVTTRYRLQITPLQGFAQGACGDTSSILVRVVPQPVLVVTASLLQVCAGTPVALQAIATRPTGVGSNLNDTYTYRWSGPGLPANTSGANITVSPTSVGLNIYSVTATGVTQYGCTVTSTVQVRVVNKPVIQVITSNSYICPGGNATLQASATAPAGFSDTYTYRFRPANGLPSSQETSATPTVTPTVTTRYSVTVSGNPITGCADTASVLVRVLPGVVADFATADSVGLNNQRTNRPPVVFTFTNKSVVTGQQQGATTTYRWTYERIRDVTGAPVTGTETVFSSAATPTPLRLDNSGSYRIRLTTAVFIISNGVTTTCVSTVKTRTVLVPDLQIPNVITPNNDGLNDVFRVSTSSTISKLEIYSRWGRKVYEQAGYQNNWGGDNQPAGVYYYLLTDRNGAQTKGWLEVVR